MDMHELRAKRDTILAIAAKHGATNVRVFGSVARGDATDVSDVDFLVDRTARYSSWWLAGIILDLEEALGHPVDVATPNTLHRLIRDRVLHEVVPI